LELRETKRMDFHEDEFILVYLSDELGNYG